MKEPREIIKRPLITEKSSGIKDINWYIFSVDRKANKKEIKDAVEKV
ncbi:MAG: 50S ribosomal protein L23, partial [Thermodesulfobacteriota bacterium]